MASPTSSTSSHISQYDILTPPEARLRESQSPSPAPARAQPRLRDANQSLFVGVHGEGDGGPEVQGPGYGHGHGYGSGNGVEGGVVRPSSRNVLLPRQGQSGLRSVLVPEEDRDGDQVVSYSQIALLEMSNVRRGRVLPFDYGLLPRSSTTTKVRVGARFLIRVFSSPAALRRMTRRIVQAIKEAKRIVTVKPDESLLHTTKKARLRTTLSKNRLHSAPTCSTNTATKLHHPHRLLLHSHACGHGLLFRDQEQAGRRSGSPSSLRCVLTPHPPVQY